MKASIETLVRAWVKDNRSYIEENFLTVEDYLIDILTYADTWEHDFFDHEEVESKSEDELREEVKEFAADYNFSPAELFNESDEIILESEDCTFLEKAGKDEQCVAYDCYDADNSDSRGYGVYERVFSAVLEKGGTIKQFAKFYGFGIYDNKDAQQLEVYKID